jgi:hypothetical protein
MHAWPEVYFRGSGWVRFEPTPGRRTGAPPAYTTAQVIKPQNPTGGPTSNGGKTATDPTSKATKRINDVTPSTGSSSGTHVPWGGILLTVLALAVLGGLAFVPGTIRRRRRSRRLRDGAEAAWAELRDSALDLGVAWPMSRSPHETGYQLAAWFGPEPDGPPLTRPPRGRGLAPGAEDALDRIVLTLERVRYARHADDTPGALAEDVRTCIMALEHGCTRRTLRRAHWLPRSLFGRGRRGVVLEQTPEAVAAGGVVDHVG